MAAWVRRRPASHSRNFAALSPDDEASSSDEAHHGAEAASAGDTIARKAGTRLSSKRTVDSTSDLARGSRLVVRMMDAAPRALLESGHVTSRASIACARPSHKRHASTAGLIGTGTGLTRSIVTLTAANPLRRSSAPAPAAQQLC